MSEIKVKNEVIDMIKSLPEDVSIEDILEELYFKIKIDKRLDESERSDGISHQEAGKKLSKWLLK
ncbi:MAG: hypothetical protein OEZ13_13360 [Spirochaetia bacterium]|nr:hypothetical protein [Spirochaetia bacterium]